MLGYGISKSARVDYFGKLDLGHYCDIPRDLANCLFSRQTESKLYAKINGYALLREMYQAKSSQWKEVF